MNLHPVQYFSFLVPLSLTLLGLALLACWRVLPQQRFLLWLSVGYVISSLTLSFQSLLDTPQMAQWSAMAGILYMGSFWALAHGMALRCDGRASPLLAAAICLITLATLVYYSWIEDEIIVRATVLNLALGLLLLLAMPAIFRKSAGDDTLEKVLRISYIVLAVYALARPVLVLTLIPDADIAHLTRSLYWVFMLSAALLFSIWFLVLLLATTLRDILRVLHAERDRDPLTQLLNRRAFFEEAERSLTDSRQGPWTLLSCDIDHFKHVNDNWGHTAGDAVLRQFGQMLQKQTRSGDMAARFGGEEFTILLTHSDLEDAQHVAERLRQQLAATQFPEIDTPITASFGLTAVTSPTDISDAIDRADALLYQAKRAGRDRVYTE
ncbi:GGDEF domain-containing protein [Pusillimonas sp. CC-YST705]|uniref:diguanylate cyclase n=1 Tax=Mesopusillimonas faecipullorum TaxID=2755040 RepID=A0ABS8CBJ8_9BURK|nr:GGDEF domain-containing protein [Mesopusillimonas faecipullorum]MCB5363416.1 GGDEF domain-containing protein [Mesopusillimonas faecipullorum]